MFFVVGGPTTSDPRIAERRRAVSAHLAVEMFGELPITLDGAHFGQANEPVEVGTVYLDPVRGHRRVRLRLRAANTVPAPAAIAPPPTPAVMPVSAPVNANGVLPGGTVGGAAVVPGGAVVDVTAGTVVVVAGWATVVGVTAVVGGTTTAVVVDLGGIVEVAGTVVTVVAAGTVVVVAGTVVVAGGGLVVVVVGGTMVVVVVGAHPGGTQTLTGSPGVFSPVDHHCHPSKYTVVPAFAGKLPDAENHLPVFPRSTVWWSVTA